jgi:hypothetical protein
VRLDDFQRLVARLAAEIPEEFFGGILEVTVSPRTLPHPTRGEIWTLGECVPVAGDTGEDVQSRVVLYHGSFAALARQDLDFDWVAEARETLQHELRHHLEWRASRSDLEALDRAAEANYARQDGQPFDPLFFLDGDSPVAGVYQVEDDWFLDHEVRHVPEALSFTWHGRRFSVPLVGLSLPAFVTVEGLPDPPPGDVVLVLRRKPRLLDVFRTEAPVCRRVTVTSDLPAAGGPVAD